MALIGDFINEVFQNMVNQQIFWIIISALITFIVLQELEK